MKDRDEILTMAASGNADALAFLRAFSRRAHWVDDLRDRDHIDITGNPNAPWYCSHRFADEEANWLTAIAGNPFFLLHRAQLIPAMISALSAWADSESFPPEQQAVLKAQWHEVVWIVAWLTGGWRRMREVCRECREFDIELLEARAVPIERTNGTLRS